MTEVDVFAKDYIKLNFLNEVVSNDTVNFHIFLESNNEERDFKEIRTNESVYRYNNFNVSEDNIQNTITFRPVVIGCYLYFKLTTSVPLKMEIIKNGTTTVAHEFVLASGESKIEFEPQGIKKYIMKVEEAEKIEEAAPAHNNSFDEQSEMLPEMSTPKFDPVENPFGDFTDLGLSPAEPQIINSTESAMDSAFGEGIIENAGVEPVDSEAHKENEKKRDQLVQSNNRLEEDVAKLQGEIRDLEEKNVQLAESKQQLIAHLDKLQKEYDTDYSSYSADIEEIKARYTIDEEILKMYADRDIVSIEELLVRSENDMKEIEEQMRIFIDAQQRKTAEIESELKIGKKD